MTSNTSDFEQAEFVPESQLCGIHNIKSLPTHRDARCLQPVEQLVAVMGLVAAGDHHAAAHDQRQQQFERGDVERDGGHGEQQIACRHAGLARHAGQQVHDRAVGDLHPLGSAGRTRGVDHIGEVVGGAGHASSWRRAGRRWRRLRGPDR